MRTLTAALSAVLLLAAGLACGGVEEEQPTPHAVLVGGPPDEPASAEDDTGTDPHADQAEPEEPDSTPQATREPMHVSLDWLAAHIDLPGLPANFAARSADSVLRDRIQDALREFEGAYSVVVHSLVDGRSAAINAHEVYYGASLFKMAVLLEAFRQQDSGELDLSRRVTLGRRYAEHDLGTLEYLGLQEDDTLSLSDAVKAMIVASDTPTALLVQDAAGGARVDATLRGLGMTHTSVNDRNLPTTAADMARLITAIAAGEGVTAESRARMLSLLAQEWFRSGVIAGIPEGKAAAHKSGSFAGATHDVALVWGPAGPYVIAVLTDASFDWEPIANVSRAVWQYFEAGG